MPDTTTPTGQPSPLLAGTMAALPIVGSIGNALLQNAANKKARKWAEKQYQTQRTDALADWQMQNAYNSPAAQMERLKAAGLNPNLVYGHGADAQSGAMPRGASAPNWAPHAPQVDLSGLGNGIMAFYDVKVKQAQLNNLAVQQELMKQDVENKKANEFKTWAEAYFTGSKHVGQDIKNKYASPIAEMTLEGMRSVIQNREFSQGIQSERLDLAKKQQNLNIKKYELDQLKAGMSMKEAAERILMMRKRAIMMELEFIQKKEQTYKTMQEHKNLMSQQDEIQQRIENLKKEGDIKIEQRRILESTPDWNDQRAVNMLESLLGRFSPSGNKSQVWW